VLADDTFTHAAVLQKQKEETFKMTAPDSIWLAADYHFPTTYSCRVPMSSMSSTRAMPAPGPATVRLALVRTGIELFGLERTRDELFPVIRSAHICIKPPEKVALSMHMIRLYKGNANRPRGEGHLDESIACREVAHASGLMTVYLQTPICHADCCRTTLRSVAYWGQANSLAWCVQVYSAAPQDGEVAVPVRSLSASYSIRQFFSCIVSEFRDTQVEWDEVMPGLRTGKMDAIRMEVYLWPMTMDLRHGGGKVLCRHAIGEKSDSGIPVLDLKQRGQCVGA
jgi:hypothetical protein